MENEKTKTKIKSYERGRGFQKRPRIGSKITIETSTRRGRSRVLGLVDLKGGVTALLVTEPRSWGALNGNHTRPHRVTVEEIRRLLQNSR